MEDARAAAGAAGEITLGLAGRRFRPVTPGSFDHFDYLTAQIDAAGYFAGGTVSEVLARVAESGRTLRLLAGLIVEVSPSGEARDWTLEGARALAEGLAQERDPAVWTAVKLAVTAALLGFLTPAPDSSGSSATASSPPAGAAGADAGEVETATTGAPSGPGSSASSPDTIPTASAASGAGTPAPGSAVSAIG